MKLDGMKERAWVEVDLDALRDNFQSVKANLADGVKLCCVVKANAYGHGAAVVSHLYETLGADCLAVSNPEEALELRLDGIRLPILILGYTAPRCAALLAEYDVIQCVFSRDYAEALSEAAAAANVTVKVHLKLDSGMGRIGFSLRDKSGLSEILSVFSLKNLAFEGIFTHFAMSDGGREGKAYTDRQQKRFADAIGSMKVSGTWNGGTPLVHAANSAAIFDYPESHFDMVRAGIVLYGYQPSEALLKQVPLTPALSLKTVVDLVKTVKAGECISYGGRFVAPHDMRVATVPIGYADGVWRMMGERGLYPSVRGHKAKVIGRICMDQCMLDVSEIPDVSAGDEVTVYGKEGEHVAELAKRCDTIAYELLCALGERLPRVYLEGGKIVSIKDRILP